MDKQEEEMLDIKELIKITPLNKIKLYLKANELENSYVTYKRIGFFDYGFCLTKCEEDKVKNKIAFKCAEIINTQLKCKVCEFSKVNWVMAINNRGAMQVPFGYNSKGDFIYIERLDGRAIEEGVENTVLVYSVDYSGSYPRKYWWGIDNNKLAGYSEECERKTFTFFFEISR